MTKLVLNLKREYFDQIRNGSKIEEYRLNTIYWHRRFAKNTYTQIELRCGYPKRGDTERIILLPWRGFTMKNIVHPHFGKKPVRVFAIVVG